MKFVDESVLTPFPKLRPELPVAYESIYDEHYRRNREGRTLASAMSRTMENWMHRMVSCDVADGHKGRSTLEIGAGSLNHLPFEPPSPAYDVVEPLKQLCLNSSHRRRVRNLHASVDGITNAEYDRIISIAAFEHFCALPSVVAKCGLLLASSGQMRIAVPSEGTILWKLGWSLTTGLEFRIRHGLKYGALMRHEHVNTADEIESVLAIFFKDTHRTVCGFSPALSLYQFFECRDPDRVRCRGYLDSGSPIFD